LPPVQPFKEILAKDAAMDGVKRKDNHGNPWLGLKSLKDVSRYRGSDRMGIR
jgi:hypothetical protein